MENWLRIERKHAPAFSILTDYRMFFSGKWCEQHLFLVLHRGFWLEGGAAVFGLGCLLAAWEGGRGVRVCAKSGHFLAWWMEGMG